MKQTEKDPYPGTFTEPHELRLLANQYACAAESLLSITKSQPSPLRSPAMLCAIHAIELYLSALMREAGEAPEKVRGYNHNLSEMRGHASVIKLRLKMKTYRHLTKMTNAREYLVVRYAPDEKERLSELNRLTATLDEVRNKVGRVFCQNGTAERGRAG